MSGIPMFDGITTGVEQDLAGKSALGSGLTSYITSNQWSNKMQNLINQADTFGPYRQQYADMLSNLMANPSDVQNMPGYAAGIQAIERSGAATGQGLGSGALETSLFKYGGDMFNQWVNTLANLGGAWINPGSLVQAEGIGYQTKQQGNSDLFSGITGFTTGSGEGMKSALGGVFGGLL